MMKKDSGVMAILAGLRGVLPALRRLARFSHRRWDGPAAIRPFAGCARRGRRFYSMSTRQIAGPSRSFGEKHRRWREESPLRRLPGASHVKFPNRRARYRAAVPRDLTVA